MKKNILYVAATLTKQSQLKLYNTVSELISIPDNWRVYCHHMTTHFKPSQFDKIPQTDLSVKILVENVFFDGKGIAVRVNPTPSPLELNMSLEQIPHITVATAPGISPAYSNELLGKMKGVKLTPFILDGFIWNKNSNNTNYRNDLADENFSLR